MKKLFILGIATIIFLTGCNVNIPGLSVDSKYHAKTIEEFHELKDEAKGEFIAIEHTETMKLRDVDTIEVATVFADIEVIYENRNDVEIQYFAFVSDKILNKEPDYTIETRNDFVFKVDWNKLNGSGYGMMRIFLPTDYDKDFTIESISGDVSADELRTRDLELSTISGDVSINELIGDDISIDTISGDTRIESLETNQLNLFSTSGDYDIFKLSVHDLKADMVSGDTLLELDNLSGDMNLDSVSGDITLSFTFNPDIRLDIESVSGDIECDYSLDNVDINKDNTLKADIGKGKESLSIDTVSGDIYIK